MYIKKRSNYTLNGILSLFLISVASVCGQKYRSDKETFRLSVIIFRVETKSVARFFSLDNP